MTTEDKLKHTRAHIRAWERRLTRASTALGKYRKQEARLIRSQAKENQKAATAGTERAFTFDKDKPAA